jgi:hypothetical protein
MDKAGYKEWLQAEQRQRTIACCVCHALCVAVAVNVFQVSLSVRSYPPNPILRTLLILLLLLLLRNIIYSTNPTASTGSTKYEP